MGGNRAASDRVLGNPFFANKPAAADPAARRLARSTFQGRFFDRDLHQVCFTSVIRR
jgi:hypothetical protein